MKSGLWIIRSDEYFPIYDFDLVDENTGRCERKSFISFCDFVKYIEAMEPARIQKVIFNPPATIVFWNDDTKTVVKARNEPFDKEKGLAMAICKKLSGNNGRYFEGFKKYCHGENLGESKDRK